MKIRIWTNEKLKTTLTIFVAVILLSGAASILATDVEPILRGIWKPAVLGSAKAVAKNDELLYIALGEGGLAIVNIENKDNPYQVGSYDAVGSVERVATSGQVAFITAGNYSTNQRLGSLELYDDANASRSFYRAVAGN